VAVVESAEIAAVVRRVGEAWASRDFETYSNLISKSPHFRGIGSDADEFWDSAEKFLSVRRVQSEELDAQGWGQAEGALVRLDAFEDGPVGWASVLFALKTPNGVVNLRVTAVLALEAGAWRVIHWHNSVPSPNVHTFGVELTTTLDELLAAVVEDTAALDTLGRSEGTMTLVFTDIVDSTILAERIGDEGWFELVKAHESDIRRATSRHGGTVVKMLGDGSMLAFESARAAVRAALDIEAATGADYAIRIGIHAGEVVRSEGDLLGITVNKAARVASIAKGGQVLISSLVAELVGTMAGVALGAPEAVTLKGLSGTHTVVSVEPG
jgi:class 3 adenylate cyclase